MVLRQVVGVETGVLIALDEREAFLELLADRQAAVVDVVEDPELHRCSLGREDGGNSSRRKAAERPHRGGAISERRLGRAPGVGLEPTT